MFGPFVSFEDNLFHERLYMPQLLTITDKADDKDIRRWLIHDLSFQFILIGHSVIFVKACISAFPELFPDAVASLVKNVKAIKDHELGLTEELFSIHRDPIRVGDFTFENGHQAMVTFGNDLIHRCGQDLEDLGKDLVRMSPYAGDDERSRVLREEGRNLKNDLPEEVFPNLKEEGVNYPIWAAGLWMKKEVRTLLSRYKTIEQGLNNQAQENITSPPKLSKKDMALSIIAGLARSNGAISVTDLAKQLGVNPSTVHRWNDVKMAIDRLNANQPDSPRGFKDKNGNIEAEYNDDDLTDD